MKKYVVLWLSMSLLSGITVAQMASGNVAESSNPRSAVIDAQNFRTRSVEGCIVQQSGNYFLVPQYGRPERLTSSVAESLPENAGRQVRVQGRESYAGNASPLADYEILAERIDLVAQSCSSNWNAKWMGRLSSAKP